MSWSYQFYRNLPFWPAYYIETEDILIMKMVWNEERMIKLCCKHYNLPEIIRTEKEKPMENRNVIFRSNFLTLWAWIITYLTKTLDVIQA
jgi:hypothetical protein